ncbi:hypothetical protein ACFWMT_01015 [Streptomyces sp. NPDC058368]|uniref:hypothetical protein n=1 Tax=Streptomyces sp. NPDC058368 TaxID=3346461 RepID=UPI003666A484
MNTRTTAVALIAAGLLAVTLTACDDGDDKAADIKPSEAPTLSAADREAAREAAGLPPKPNAATTAAYVKALDAIDTDIVHGKTEKAVDRGLNTCSSVKSSPNDQAKLIDLTNQRFSSPTHPQGHGPETAEKILSVVRKNLCPDF